MYKALVYRSQMYLRSFKKMKLAFTPLCPNV